MPGERRRLRQRECGEYERRWQGRCVDKNLADDWLFRLNDLRCFDLISICEGHSERGRSRTAATKRGSGGA